MADNDYLHIAQIMEATMPHVDIKTKLTIDLMSKLFAFMGSYRNFNKADNLAVCGFENQKMELEGLLTAVRPLCTGKERALVDQILSMFNAKRMFETYKTYMEAMKAMQGFEGSPFGDFSSQNNSESSSDNASGFDFSSFFNAFNNNSGSDSDNNPDGSDPAFGSDSGHGTDSFSDSVSDNDDSFTSDSTESKDASSKETTGTDKGSDNKNNMMNMLKAMVPPEQLSTFENLSILFNTMSYDNNKSDQV